MNGSLYFELKIRLANRSEVCRNKINIKNNKVFVGDLAKPIVSISARPEHENKEEHCKKGHPAGVIGSDISSSGNNGYYLK